jgi:hypothetical protein
MRFFETVRVSQRADCRQLGDDVLLGFSTTTEFHQECIAFCIGGCPQDLKGIDLVQ